ncbi:MAG: DUF2817 domain-containing protein [Oligoflexia bacterium]|nr:DUF2817 domain-containing protein [Oligoflexia bacterium]
MKETKKIITHSAGGLPIEMYVLGNINLPKFFLIGGVHGDEPEGSVLVWDFIKNAQSVLQKLNSCCLAIPDYNPDGLKNNQRVNANGVDLNRNFPASDWSPEFKAPRYNPGKQPESEPETKALAKLLRETNPFLVIHCHTYVPQMNYTGERSKKWALKLMKNFNHPITDDIGYPTPGSLGQFCYYNLKTACVCIELPEQVEQQKAWDMVGPALLELAINGDN